MRRKILFNIFMVCVLLVFLTVSLNTFAAKVEMVIGLTDPPDPNASPIYKGALVFKDYVENKSQGEIEVKIIPGGALGSHTSIFKQVMDNIIQATLNISEGNIAGFYKPIQVIGIPYLVSNIQVGYELFDSQFFTSLWDDMRKEIGVVTLSSFVTNGLRNFTNNVRPIKSPKDMKGLKIRVMDVPAHIEMIKSLGGFPTPVPALELYGALQTGVVDGQENSLVAIDILKLNEVQKYLSMDGHLIGVNPFIVNEVWFNELNKNYQRILRDGAKLATTTIRGDILYKEIILVEQFKDSLEIYFPSLDEIQEFREATQRPIIDFLEGEVDKKWIDGILDAVEKIEGVSM